MGSRFNLEHLRHPTSGRDQMKFGVSTLWTLDFEGSLDPDHEES